MHLVNSRTNSISQNITVTVVEPPFESASIQVLISPAVTKIGLEPYDGGLLFNATVSDDGGSLTYAWDKDGVTFGSLSANPNIGQLLVYNQTVTGTITLRVTDADGNITTVSFALQMGQFPDTVFVVRKAVKMTSLAGGEHILLLKNNGGLWTWGRNTYGQLGNGGTTNTVAPAQLGSSTEWATVAAGPNHSLAIKKDNTLWAWGRNNYGQLGQGSGNLTDSAVPIQVGSYADWIAVKAGHTFSVGQRSDTSLWVWGNSFTTTPTMIGSDTDWADYQVGGAFILARKTNGTLWTLGDNSNGELGRAGAFGGWYGSFGQVGSATDWTKISAGVYSAHAINVAGELWGWGINGSGGALGDGTQTNRHAPVRIGSSSDWAKVSDGTVNGWAIKTDGTLWSWGNNREGQLGIGTYGDVYGVGGSAVPVQVGTDNFWTSIISLYASVAWQSVLATTSSGAIYGWGNNEFRQVNETAGPNNLYGNPAYNVPTLTGWSR